jgi:ribonuclease T1
MPHRTARPIYRVALSAVLFIVTLSLVGCGLFAPRARSAGVPGSAAYPREARDLPAIQYEDLPREAKHTLQLIDEGGPFPYDQDGQTFENREGILPDRPTGYYAEYTVETPGSDDRGARRIVAGDGGERYYTEDHYDSFSRVIR